MAGKAYFNSSGTDYSDFYKGIDKLYSDPNGGGIKLKDSAPVTSGQTSPITGTTLSSSPGVAWVTPEGLNVNGVNTYKVDANGNPITNGPTTPAKLSSTVDAANPLDIGHLGLTSNPFLKNPVDYGGWNDPAGWSLPSEPAPAAKQGGGLLGILSGALNGATGALSSVANGVKSLPGTIAANAPGYAADVQKNVIHSVLSDPSKLMGILGTQLAHSFAPMPPKPTNQTSLMAAQAKAQSGQQQKENGSGEGNKYTGVVGTNINGNSYAQLSNPGDQALQKFFTGI